MMPKSNPLTFRFILVSLGWIIGAYATVLVLPTQLLVRITQEDSFFENLTFLAFFAAAGVFMYLYFARPERNNFLFFTTRKNLFYLLAAILFFFCGGEEISWGQRVFNTTATGMFADNLQQETTLHNQPAFVYEYYDQNGRVVQNGGLLLRVFRQENLINLFCYSWCLLVPLSSLLVARLRRFWAVLNVPLMPLWMGGLLVLNNALLHVGRLLLPGNSELTGIKIVEIKECGIALLFLSIGVWFWLQNRRQIAAATLLAPENDASVPVA
ncbi:hypothetical protein [Hymenobacter glacialis]|uniref:Uncharacterized protein n=1 Tax=Hymenobacter glacialis TaxID=1908236 RepID=A0A1G1SYR8_9BACT|nr:hypothetical protein [Hymenobacter glacialis]OGX83771.1 hypothetical protein BEN48_03095 [Hymenobacter glacialis]